MEDNVSKIKDRLDIVDIVGSYVKLQKAGINYKGRCPFHNEKTPSFFVTPERQIWHCFGCAKGGDMFEFIKEIEGVEFPEALKILATRAGVELETFRPTDTHRQDAKTKLYEITELAVKFFQKQFESTTGKLALKYLLDRGMNLETIREFRLGFAPNDWESLSKYLVGRGYTENEIVDAGLAVRRPADRGRQGVYDRFRSRIMFPIFDLTGQAVGFSGRVFESPSPSQESHGSAIHSQGVDQGGQVMAKYINTPQTLIYDKSRVLYGLAQAKLDIKRADRCVLVEGNMDALMSYQAGVRNVVAASGTALTPHHLRLLQRYTKNLGFCFDTDQAGSMATKRGIGLALAQQFNINIIAIKDRECKDPADYVKKHGSGWAEVVSQAKPVLDYYFDQARSSYNPVSAESKKSVIAALAPFLKRLSSGVERSHWLGQLASLLQVPESAVVADVQTAKDDLEAYIRSESVEPTAQTAKAPARIVDKPDALNEALLSLALKIPVALEELEVPYELLHPDTAAIIRQLPKESPFDFGAFVTGFEKDQALHLEFAHLRAQELWNEFQPDDLRRELQQVINLFRRRGISARLASLQFDLKAAEQSGDSSRIAQLAGEFTALAQELNTLNNLNLNNAQNQESQNQIKAEQSSGGESRAQSDSEEASPETNETQDSSG
ncbi:MAG TPA: DNA primase [Candidatus Paceibacterota bacterium]|nr:DNA primase [Candidatus Paceibacterota bacterium]